jgi:uncharacterized protein YndB with AHSA1/START domain
MEKLFVQKSIEINAEAKKVWKALTEPSYTKDWVEMGWGQDMNISSDWKYGSDVLWKNNQGSLLVKGSITDLIPYKLLRFTVNDVSSKEKFPINEEDGITYELIEHNGDTTLNVRQGDFSVMKQGVKYHNQTDEIWNRVLPKVKELAEAEKNIMEQPTCGKGLAENAVLPARFSEIMGCMAENLELHMQTLDLSNKNAKLEYAAYQNLVMEHKDIAVRLMNTARNMYSYYDLPIAKHDEKKLENPAIATVFKKFNSLEEELIALLRRRMKKDKKILAEIHEA